jgi:hypothetical protein
VSLHHSPTPGPTKGASTSPHSHARAGAHLFVTVVNGFTQRKARCKPGAAHAVGHHAQQGALRHAKASQAGAAGGCPRPLPGTDSVKPTVARARTQMPTLGDACTNTPKHSPSQEFGVAGDRVHTHVRTRTTSCRDPAGTYSFNLSHCLHMVCSRRAATRAEPSCECSAARTRHSAFGT